MFSAKARDSKRWLSAKYVQVVAILLTGGLATWVINGYVSEYTGDTFIQARKEKNTAREKYFVDGESPQTNLVRLKTSYCLQAAVADPAHLI